MKQTNDEATSVLRPQSGIVSFILTGAILGGSLLTASALGKRNKPWERQAAVVQAAEAVDAEAVSLKTKRGKSFVLRHRGQAELRTKSAAVTVLATTQVTAAAEKPATAERGSKWLCAWIFGSGSHKEKAEANVAAAREKRTQVDPAAPDGVQAPLKFDQALIDQAKSLGSRVVVNIEQQRAYVYVGDQVAVDTPVSTARSGKMTPRGTFGVGERVREGKISTIYHVGMPYWMRLGSTPYGMHAGYLPGYPASAGCIRMPYEAAQKVYECTSYGTRVKVVGE
jgi:lipoprotein-anchoring transpeptidase ErfK/SrfK